MKLIETIINWVAGSFKVPPDALRMFRISNEISGIDRNTLPTELIPLNSIQLSRGLLNFTILQSLSNWVLPYWAEKQYSPQNPSFIPRSHLGLSMNITNRNWTAVGTPGCSVEPVVDPAGMVTPFINGWSVDTWLKVDNEIFFPSKAEGIIQRLIDDMPVVETKFNFKNVQMVLTTYTRDNILIHQAGIKNLSGNVMKCEIIFAIRPFNPEGVAIINDVAYVDKNRCLVINKDKQLFLKQKPDYVLCSNLKEGDSAALLNNALGFDRKNSSSCMSGMSSMSAGFKAILEPDAEYSTEAFCLLEGIDKKHNESLDHNETVSFWKDLVSEGTLINIPDGLIKSIYSASVSSLLLLKDKDLITPGPFIYHQFWFRDAAYMLWALDKLGYHKYTKEIISTYPAYQLKDGYFRSQKGEWDSNGQAIWSVYQHALLSDDYEMLDKQFVSLFKGIKWIDKKRITSGEYREKPFYGLLPAGLSAEHLGLADYYFWDNIWSIAGIEAFIEICKILDRRKEGKFAESLLNIYKQHFLNAVETVQKQYNIKSMPASPTRSIDCGMIGTICVSYPLQVLSPDDRNITATLNVIVENYFVKNMFYQNFVHSGLNIYLTLQVAHAYLYAGDRKKFWDILLNVINSASGTFNYPEAIHPLTGGGCMGDGHHGWASAEIVLALHEAFVFDTKDKNSGQKSLVFLQGIPADWFTLNKEFSIKNAHTAAGIISIECKAAGENFVIDINYTPYKMGNEFKWFIKLPHKIKDAYQDLLQLKIEYVKDESVIEVKPGNTTIKIVY